MRDRPKITTDHRIIRKWIEEHNGVPARVSDEMAVAEESGVLRVYFPKDERADGLEPLSWDMFFQKFDQAHLAFMYEEKPDGDESRFFKIVSINGE
ncbi:MAG: hypothetical protein ACLFVQ_01535 [Chitinispirillaceae bacterium]